MGYDVLAKLSAAELEAALADCGIRPTTEGGETAWDAGMRPSDPALLGAVKADGRPLFVPAGAGAGGDGARLEPLGGPKVCLWDYARAAAGGPLPLNWQRTGSCVHGGMANAILARMGVEVLKLPQPEAFLRPFTLNLYAYSRYLCGWNTPGAGSSGDTIATALNEIGFLRPDLPNLPQPAVYGPAYSYTAPQETHWSAWRNVPADLRQAGKPFTGEFGVVKTLEQAEDAIRRLEPLTVAGNWGGRMRCGYKGEGAERVLWNAEQAATWNHQQSVWAVWHHPAFGRLWYWINQWYMLVNGRAVSLHGQPANGEPEGGYWTTDAALRHQLQYRWGEVRSVRSLRGFTDYAIDLGRV